MESEVLLLIGRDTADAQDIFETYASRLLDRGTVDQVRVETYEQEPGRELRESLRGLDHDSVYAVSMSATRTADTTERVPAALSAIPGDVRYCDHLGEQPAVTDVVLDRATDELEARADTSLALVGLGSRSGSEGATERHAERLRERTDYDEIVTCYLMQNPAVECVRYNVSHERVVALPLFLTHSEATEQQIPARLELDRGGIAYADPLGIHERLVDAIETAVDRQRELAAAGVESVTAGRTPLAADGDGRPQ